MTRSIRTSAILARHAMSNRGASVLLAVLLLVVTFAGAVLPRALAQLSTAELNHELDSVATVVKDVSNEGNVYYTSGPGVGTSSTAGDGTTALPAELLPSYGAMDDALRELTADLPQPLSGALGAPDYFGRMRDAIATPSAVESKRGVRPSIRFAVDPRFESRITITAGEFPTAWADGDATLDVTMSTRSAKEMLWDIGETREVSGFPDVRLTGTFDPTDATARYWKHATSVAVPQIFDDGNGPRTVTASVFVNPLSAVSASAPDPASGADSPAATSPLQLDNMGVTLWYPLATASFDVADATTIAPQLRKFTATVHALPAPRGAPNQPLTLVSGTLDAIDRALARTAVTSAVLSMAASGPIGVVLAVFALGARSVVERRRPALALAAARGGSGWQLRGAMALEGLLLGVVPGAIAIGLTVLLLPVRVGIEAYLPAIGLALAPAVLFAAASTPDGLRSTRADLGARGGGRIRWISEIITVLLAGVAFLLLVRRGLTANGTFDPLLAATPLLLSLAVCVGVLRLYPLPIRALERWLRRGPGLIGFLGAARAVRDPAAGAAAALAIIVAVSVGVFSATLLSTIDTATTASARTAVGGGDLTAEAVVFFTDEQRATIAAVDGVTGIAGVDDQGVLTVTTPDGDSKPEFLQAETTELARIRSDIPGDLATKVGAAIPVVISDDLLDALPVGTDFTAEGPDGETPLTVVASLPAASGLGATATWILADTSLAPGVVDLVFAPQTLIVSTDGTATATAAVADATARAVPTATVTTYDQALAATQESPTASGLRLALLLAILGVALLAALAVVLTSVIGAPSRNRAIGALRTLGLSPRQTGGLVAWELAPVVLTALLAGTLLGLALPFVVTSTVDLSAFTGGTPVAGPHFDPLVVLAVLAVVLVSAAIGSLFAVVLSLRNSPANSVKIGAD